MAFESLEGDKTCTMNRGAPRTRAVSQEAAWHSQEMAGRLVSIKICVSDGAAKATPCKAQSSGSH